MKKVMWLCVLVCLLTGCIGKQKSENGLADGIYEIQVQLEGGSGRASIESPATLRVSKGKMEVKLVWSSSNYDYMIIDGKKYTPVEQEAHSVFEIPVENLDQAMTVIADTTAMSQPHEITYTLYFDASPIEEGEKKSELKEQEYMRSLEENPPQIDGLEFQEEVPLSDAQCFQIFRYKEGYSLICVEDGERYLLIPEGKNVPKNVPKDYQVIKKPLQNVYLAATSSMSLFDAIDEVETVRLSGTKASNWYVEHAKEAMEKKDILFAGKYSAPDYELLIAEGCDLAIESTMILHSPEVKEKLEQMKIPVLTDRSSYENEPLGRTEWIKIYGELTGKEKEAEDIFKAQKEMVSKLDSFSSTDQTIAFFYVNENGMIVTKKSSDYMVKIMQQAGGRYIFESLGDADSKASQITMSMEDFYVNAKDADYLIYNAAIENELDSMDGLVKKNSLFADFKAVKENNVWCTKKSLYQSTDKIGNIIVDFHQMLTDGDSGDYMFLNKVK